MSFLKELPQATAIKLAGKTYFTADDLQADLDMVNRFVWYAWDNYGKRAAEKIVPAFIRWYVIPKFEEMLTRAYGPRPAPIAL